RANRASSLAAVKGRADDGEAAWHEKGGADALNRTGDDQGARRIGEGTGDGRDREEPDAAEKHALASELVTERTANQNQATEKQRVRFDHPLHIRDRRLQVPLQGGQRDVDDRGVDERHARPDDGGRERPPLRRASHRQLADVARLWRTSGYRKQ